MGLIVFTFVVLIGRVFRLTDILLNSNIPGSLAGELILLLMPGILSWTIPMAVLVAILLAVGRLAADREILAIRTSGVNLFHICIPILLLASALTALMMLANQRLIPYLHQRTADVGMQLEFHVLSALAPGIVQELPSEGKGSDTRFFYDQKKADGSGEMRGVMMYMELPSEEVQARTKASSGAGGITDTKKTARQNNNKASGKEATAQTQATAKSADERPKKQLPRRERERRKLLQKEYSDMNEALVVAQSARIVPDISQRVLNFELTSGSIHFSNAGKPGAYDLVRFDTMRKGYVPVFARTEEGYYIKKTNEMSSAELMQSRREAGNKRGARFMVELLQRYSVPLACIAFALIAIPLAVYVRPTGKAIAFAMSFLLILVYYGLLQYGIALGKNGSTLGAVAIFLPNVLLMSVGSILLYRMVLK